MNIELAYKLLSNCTSRNTPERERILEECYNHSKFTRLDIYKSLIFDGVNISISSVYNTLDLFTKIGILNRYKDIYSKNEYVNISDTDSLYSTYTSDVISKACKYFEDNKRHCTILELKQKCEMIVKACFRKPESS